MLLRCINVGLILFFKFCIFRSRVQITSGQSNDISSGVQCEKENENTLEISRKIGAFETSILPYEDCCTVFTPRHPKTRPELESVLEQQNRLNFDELVERAYATRQKIVVTQFRDNKIEP